MIIKKNTLTALGGGILLPLAFAAAPLHAQSTTDVKTDPTVTEAAEGSEMTAEEVEMAAEKMEAEAEEAAAEMEEGAEEAAEAVEGAAETALDAADDDETAAMLQQELGTHPQLGVYGLDVIEIDGRYQVTGMIDKSEDYATLEQMIQDVEGVDPSMIDNNVVQQ